MPAVRIGPTSPLVIAALLAGACSSQGGARSVPQAKNAVVQIDVTGTFVDPEKGEVPHIEGRGSGYIITEGGLAITNNHVVTGASKIKVRVPGKGEVPAKVLGASECADLAVIDIDGEGYDFLEFADNAATTGQEVFAVGYPLGVWETTLKKGVVERVKGPKATDWAAVPGVMQHSAEIKPGNSGGPLVNEDGRVVGVNYAGTSRHFYAITAGAAVPIVDKLRKGKSVESLGINGQAISVGEATGGVFIASLATASPPDRLGMSPFTTMGPPFVHKHGTTSAGLAGCVPCLRDHRILLSGFCLRR